jgi:hypothetical protein
VGTWVALKYRVPAAATSMSRNGMARGYCTTRPWSVTRTMEAPRSRTSKKTRAMSTPMGNSQAWPDPQARAGSWAASRRAKNDKVSVAEGEERQGEGGGGDAQAEEQGGAEDGAQVRGQGRPHQARDLQVEGADGGGK